MFVELNITLVELIMQHNQYLACTIGQKKKETPLFILIQIIVQK